MGLEAFHRSIFVLDQLPTTEHIPLSQGDIWRLSVLARLPRRNRKVSAIRDRYLSPLSDRAKKIGRVLLGEATAEDDANARQAARDFMNWAKRNTRRRGRARKPAPRHE